MHAHTDHTQTHTHTHTHGLIPRFCIAGSLLYSQQHSSPACTHPMLWVHMYVYVCCQSTLRPTCDAPHLTCALLRFFLACCVHVLPPRPSRMPPCCVTCARVLCPTPRSCACKVREAAVLRGPRYARFGPQANIALCNRSADSLACKLLRLLLVYGRAKRARLEPVGTQHTPYLLVCSTQQDKRTFGANIPDDHAQAHLQHTTKPISY